MRARTGDDADDRAVARGAWRRRGFPRALLGAMLALAALVTPVQAQEGCRLPSADQYDAGGALEGVELVLHGLRDEAVPLDDGLAFGDPGPCPGGSLDAFRGIDIMGWALEVSGPTAPEYCSPNDPPILELPLPATRCVEPSTTVASRNARVAYGELLPRAPFPMLLPEELPDGLVPHWTTLRVTARRADAPVPRQFGTILRYRGEAESPWLLLLIDTGIAGEWLLDELRANGTPLAVRGVDGAAFEGLPDYSGPGTGLVWAEEGLRLILFGTYPAEALAEIAERLAWRDAAPEPPPPPPPYPWRQ